MIDAYSWVRSYIICTTIYAVFQLLKFKYLFIYLEKNYDFVCKILNTVKPFLSKLKDLEPF